MHIFRFNFLSKTMMMTFSLVSLSSMSSSSSTAAADGGTEKCIAWLITNSGTRTKTTVAPFLV